MIILLIFPLMNAYVNKYFVTSPALDNQCTDIYTVGMNWNKKFSRLKFISRWKLLLWLPILGGNANWFESINFHDVG